MKSRLSQAMLWFQDRSSVVPGARIPQLHISRRVSGRESSYLVQTLWESRASKRKKALLSQMKGAAWFRSIAYPNMNRALCKLGQILPLFISLSSGCTHKGSISTSLKGIQKGILCIYRSHLCLRPRKHCQSLPNRDGGRGYHAQSSSLLSSFLDRKLHLSQ